VIGVDTNLLVHAHRRESAWFEAAWRCVQALAEGSARWAIPWPCVHEFLAVVTHPRILRPPTPMADALAQVEAWRESPSLVLLAEGPTHWRELRTAVEQGRVAGPVVHDARVAALCRQHGVRELWTADRDFGRFPGLAVRNPLVG
jgi:hypothetical protein